MCGIIGFYGITSGSQYSDHRSFMLQGLHVTALRGGESTGIAVLPKGKTTAPEVYKRALHATDFIEKKNTLRLLSNITTSNGVLGHTRSMTRGSIMDENSHPFQYKHITLVHNGTVQNADWLLSKKCGADSTVDSAQVAWAFSEAEPDDLLDRMTGGYSLVWWDARDATLHFARNTEKPMYWVVSEKADCMYFASELGMLRMLVDRIGIKIKKEAFFTAPYKHYIYKNPANVEEYTTRPFHNPSRKSKGRSNQYPAKILPPPSSNPSTSSILHDKPQLPSPSGRIDTSSQATKSTTTSGSDTEDTKDSNAVTAVSLSSNYLWNEMPDRRHPAQDEDLTRGRVEAITSGMGHKDRLRFTETLADKRGVELGKPINGKPVAWRTYKDEQRYGHMFLRADKNNIQLFNVNLALWVKCASMGMVPVVIKGHRLNFDGADGNTPVFIGEIDFDLFQKMYNNFEKVLHSKQRPRVSGENLIEVGLAKPRFVTLQEFNELTEDGCWNCQGILLPQDADSIHWFGPDEAWPICSSCSAMPQVISEWTKLATERRDTSPYGTRLSSKH